MYTIKTLFLALVGFFLLSCAFENASLSSGDLPLLQEKTFQTAINENLDVSVMGGDIIVKTWSKNEVHVKAYGNDKAAEQLEFTIEKTSSGVRVKTDKKDKGRNNFSGIQTRFEITVPEKYNTELKTAGGNITISKMTGKAELKSAGGNIEVTELSGKLEVSTAGGNITVNGHTGSKELKTAGGEIIVERSDGDIEAASAGGPVHLQVENGSVEAASSGGPVTVEYEGDNMGIELHSTGGPVTLILPSGFAADIQMGSTGGSIDCEFELTEVRKKSDHRLKGSINGGGEEVDMYSTGGSVKIKKK